MRCYKAVPVDAFPSLCIVRMFFVISCSFHDSEKLTRFDSLGRDFLFVAWSLQREEASNRFQCRKPSFQRKELLITAMGISWGSCVRLF